MRTLIFFAIASPLLLASCDRHETPVAKSSISLPQWPRVDASTPDNALRSYWARRDVLSAYVELRTAEEIAKWAGVRKELEAVMVEPVARSLVDGEGSNVAETFSRDILEVKVESGSRAVVVAVLKNITPIPQGVEVTKFDEERRRDGERYKYVLFKDQSGWRVAEIWEWSNYPSPEWKKYRPGDGKPRVPSMAYFGV